MKTPREILLQQHEAIAPKLDAIRAGVVAGLERQPAPEAISWREWARSLRWHFAALGAAWVLVMVLSMDNSPSAVAMIPRDKIPPPQQLWASLRANRRLLQEFSEVPAVEPAPAPGRRSEIAGEQVEV